MQGFYCLVENRQFREYGKYGININFEKFEMNFSGNFGAEFDINMTELDLVSNHLT